MIFFSKLIPTFDTDSTIFYWIVAMIGIVFLSVNTPSRLFGQDYPQAPRVAEASDEGEKAIKGFVYPRNLEINLFAAEPDVANPVAFHVDHQGRVFVCESFRQGKGIEDNRNHAEWLDDDLAAQTVADRIAYIKKHLKERAIEYTRHDDRIRLLIDSDQDGRADSSSVFANGFNQIEMGSGAGVLSYDGKVYYTCIPNLWMIEDKNSDGLSDNRISLHAGYGVRFAFRGHDSHGLIVGPDKRLYFSIGDRGYNVKTSQSHLKDPASGAVFRCELDGSNLEVIATGLRNPQELAFDEFGNLFTGDNNSDSGDKARWVFVVPGSDSGWRMYYQYLPDRGPFNREQLWHPYQKGKSPAYIVPPVANIADGPSGLAYYPGTGLGDQFKGRFFLCDFRGGPANSGIRTFRVKPKGAFFEVVDMEKPFWRQLITDVQFAPDGSMLASDWVNGWNGLGKGRIYRYTNPAAGRDMAVTEVKNLLATGLKNLDADRLVTLLESPDQRIRQESQFELADRRQTSKLLKVANNTRGSTLSRIHSLWAIAQILRQDQDELLLSKLGKLAQSEDEEVVAQFVRLIGEHGRPSDSKQICELLDHENSRVRFFSAMALSKIQIGNPEDYSKLFQMLEENADEDPILRHGGIMALLGDSQLLNAATAHPSRFVRLAAMIATRKLKQDASGFLNDPEPAIVLEAVRALHDLPEPTSKRYLAISKLIDRNIESEPVMRRVLNANYILGGISEAKAIARYAAAGTTSEKMQLEALDILKNWNRPRNRDRVLGDFRPQLRQDSHIKDAAMALEEYLPGLLSGGPKLTQSVIDAAAALNVTEIKPSLLEIFGNQTGDVKSRADALRAMAALNVAGLEKQVQTAMLDPATQVRIAAREILSRTKPQQALQSLEVATTSQHLPERQAALATLGQMGPPAESAIVKNLQSLVAGKTPIDTQLDVLMAAEKIGSASTRQLLNDYRKSKPTNDPLAQFSECLEGGNALRGKAIFFEKTAVYCMRCHRIEARGGQVGPELSSIGKEKDRKYLLQAIVDPNGAIAKNFETVLVATDDGLTYSGILQTETDDQLVLMTPESKTVTIEKKTIEQRGRGISSMPADLIKNLSASEIRDLVEFLSSLN